MAMDGADECSSTSTDPLLSTASMPSGSRSSFPNSWMSGLVARATRWTRQPNTTYSVPTPVSTATQFLHDFEDKYGTDHVPFFQGGYAQALDAAKKDLRFLLVVLQSDEHDDTDVFNRDVLASTELAAFVHHHSILVWAGSIHDAEAFQVSNTLQVSTYPFIAIISIQPPEASSSTSTLSAQKMIVADRIEGFLSVQDVTRRVELVMDRVEPAIGQWRAEQEQRVQDQRLREAQEEAYRESLRIDREKARKEREARESARRKEEELRQREEAKHRYIQYLYAHLPPEPSDSDPVEKTKLVFRMPDGERVMRRFPGDASLKSLYDFIEVYPLLKRHASVEDVDAPIDYHHTFSFSIYSAILRKKFPPDDAQNLRDIAELWPNALLIVDTEEALSIHPQ